jgi:hypothetical protein
MDPQANTPTETNKSSLSKILLTLLAIAILFSVVYVFRTPIKRFFGVATIAYPSASALQAMNSQNNWKVSLNTAERYAWSESSGWIDFAPTNGSVYVADDGLWGWAYGENVGWISLNCHNDEQTCSYPYSVSNDGEGRLSGYAWGENVGWINFGTSTVGTRPYGVSIDSNGNFQGYAYGENVGWISFNSTNGGDITYKVSTNWRYVSSRTASSTTTGRRRTTQGADQGIGGDISGGVIDNTASSSVSTSTLSGTNSTTSSSTPSTTPTTASSSSPIITSGFTRNLGLGMTGDDVKALQVYLNNKGFTVAINGPGSPGNETTYYGSLTANAITNFQEAHTQEILDPAGLRFGTGFFGNLTRAYVNSHP